VSFGVTTREADALRATREAPLAPRRPVRENRSPALEDRIARARRRGLADARHAQAERPVHVAPRRSPRPRFEAAADVAPEIRARLTLGRLGRPAADDIARRRHEVRRRLPVTRRRAASRCSHEDDRCGDGAANQRRTLPGPASLGWRAARQRDRRNSRTRCVSNAVAPGSYDGKLESAK
jgi:hypothetical protein